MKESARKLSEKALADEATKFDTPKVSAAEIEDAKDVED